MREEYDFSEGVRGKHAPIKKELRTYQNAAGETEVTLAWTEKKEDELCDFCSMLKPPYKVYQCPDFPHPLNPLWWSRGDWNACAKCAEFVDANDPEGLFERCMLLHALDTPDLKGDYLRAFQAEFFKQRLGSAPPEPKSDQPGSP